MSETTKTTWADVSADTNIYITLPTWGWIGFSAQPMKRVWFDENGRMHQSAPILQAEKMPDWVKSLSINGVEVYHKK